jgi:Uma2 family endonuclease
MSLPHTERPELPEYMTWEELEQLPEEIAEQIELWDGRVIWLRRGPMEHQAFSRRLTNALESCARKTMAADPQHCWRVESETNVFLDSHGKSDFLTPDFLVCRYPKTPFEDIRANTTLLVGEVLSPSNTQTDMEAKKGRYASAGIPWYWEVTLAREVSAIATVRAYGLETGPGRLPGGVRPLRSANYLLAGEWSPGNPDGIRIEFPFPITIPWTELEY